MTIQEQFELANAKHLQEMARKECEYWFGKFCYYIPEQCSEEKFKEWWEFNKSIEYKSYYYDLANIVWSGLLTRKLC
jgi:hypothetical protein